MGGSAVRCVEGDRIGRKWMRLKKIALLLLVVSLAACNESALIKKFARPEDVARAKHYIALLQAKQFGEIERLMDPSVDESDAHSSLEGMASAIPPGPPLSVKLVGAWRAFSGNLSTHVRARTSKLVLEYHFPERWLVISVLTKEAGGVFTILGMTLDAHSESLEEINSFTLAGRDASDYFLLLSAFAIMLFTIYALVACIRTPMGHGKWFWIPFILIGFGRDVLNWTTGGVTLRLLMIQFPPASFSHWTYAPWYFSLSLPLGALLFVFWRKGRSGPRRARVVIGEGVLGVAPSSSGASEGTGAG